MIIFFVCLVPVRLLLSSTAGFVPREWLAAKGLSQRLKHLPRLPVQMFDFTGLFSPVGSFRANYSKIDCERSFFFFSDVWVGSITRLRAEKWAGHQFPPPLPPKEGRDQRPDTGDGRNLLNPVVNLGKDSAPSSFFRPKPKPVETRRRRCPRYFFSLKDNPFSTNVIISGYSVMLLGCVRHSPFIPTTGIFLKQECRHILICFNFTHRFTHTAK